MLKTTAFLLAGLVAGLVAASFWSDDNGLDHAPVAASRDALAARLEALESALDRETARRAALEREVAALSAEVERVLPGRAATRLLLDEDAVAAGVPPEPGRAEPAETQADADADTMPPFMRRRLGRDGDEDLAARLVAAGFSADRAAFIEARTNELRMEALQAQYDAARDGVPLAERLPRDNVLRGELGDAEYERYLEAVGRPTAVRVGGVLASSPAEQAGLAPGDEVVSYAGRRVFDMRDLNSLILEGQPGEPVVVDVLRDGQPIQVVLPRGPLGISGRGFNRGR